jgi:AcrR family transcriptional regulator
MASDRREHLIETALQLFYQHGYHATGIDTILAASGVAKRTLYKHFASKDVLILAVLRRRDEEFRTWFTQALERRVADPRERLLVVFDLLHEWLSTPGFHGCLFINATAEFARHDDPIHMAAAEHKRLFAAYLCGLAAAAGAPEPQRLGQQLALLVEGAIVTAQMRGQSDAVQQARRAAEVLVAQALA